MVYANVVLKVEGFWDSRSIPLLRTVTTFTMSKSLLPVYLVKVIFNLTKRSKKYFNWKDKCHSIILFCDKIYKTVDLHVKVTLNSIIYGFLNTTYFWLPLSQLSKHRIVNSNSILIYFRITYKTRIM